MDEDLVEQVVREAQFVVVRVIVPRKPFEADQWCSYTRSPQEGCGSGVDPVLLAMKPFLVKFRRIASQASMTIARDNALILQ